MSSFLREAGTVVVNLEFPELSKSGLSGVGSVGYVNAVVFTILSYRPS